MADPDKSPVRTSEHPAEGSAPSHNESASAAGGGVKLEENSKMDLLSPKKRDRPDTQGNESADNGSAKRQKGVAAIKSE
jgi:hypothetical protein